MYGHVVLYLALSKTDILHVYENMYCFVFHIFI